MQVLLVGTENCDVEGENVSCQQLTVRKGKMVCLGLYLQLHVLIEEIYQVLVGRGGGGYQHCPQVHQDVRSTSLFYHLHFLLLGKICQAWLQSSHRSNRTGLRHTLGNC
jgi:hypothetical protein